MEGKANKFKTNILEKNNAANAHDEIVTPKVQKIKKPNKLINGLSQFFSGGFMSHNDFAKQIPFIFYIGFLCMLYIFNSYKAESKVREINKLSNELKELRSEYITTKSDLMHLSKQSQIAQLAKNISLYESINAPYKIYSAVENE